MVRLSWGLVGRAKPFIGVMFLNAGFAGMDVLCMAALKQGMNSFVFLVYANLIATAVLAPFAVVFDRNEKTRITLRVFPKILLLSTMEAACGNLYFIGMKHTSATFAATMGNTLPALAFLLAWMLGLEHVKCKDVWSRVKVMGTLVTVAGAMVMTLIKGPMIPLVWTQGRHLNEAGAGAGAGAGGGGEVLGLQGSSIWGAALLAAAYFLWASFIIVQAIVLREYPAELSLTTWISIINAMECILITVTMQGTSASIWTIKWDIKTKAALYNVRPGHEQPRDIPCILASLAPETTPVSSELVIQGVICVGIGYYIQAAVTKVKGPVFVTAFSPLSAVMVAIIASFVLAEQQFLGRVVGAAIIVGGLYLVLWAKSKDYLLMSPDSPVEAEEFHKGEEEEEKPPRSSNHQMDMESHDANLMPPQV
ncbi:hypothetical protein SAY86_015041 [Trapa natans]|uniref:EamA domain-containing protein n=1 Tax=Trapa natans TaxID=22666 RepID=A0AAN7KHJ3_TRANT|nr:hypothetical protein SAY86_015041 [Trapa natans]